MNDTNDKCDQPGLTLRPTVRVLLMDGSNRILLLASQEPDGSRFWYTPGGGSDRGESIFETAQRELREETGLRVRDITYHGEIARRRVVASIADVLVEIQERWLLGSTLRTDITSDGFTDDERRTVIDVRWWTIDELMGATDRLVPSNLAEFASMILTDGVPGFPVELTS